ncbi:MAG TPA: DUF4194 domain-containing protein [Gammaproteobacteria bacterium]
MDATRASSLSAVLITLFKGVLYQDQHADLWQALLQLQAKVRDHAGVFGLELVLDEAEGYAYLRQRPAAEDEELPRLVQRRQLGFAVSLLLALLRKKLAEHDAAGGDPRLILSRAQIVDLVQLFLPSGTDEAKLVDRIDADINRVVELGFLRRLRGQDDQYEVRRILKAFVDAQWLNELEQRLAQYRAHLEGGAPDA